MKMVTGVIRRTRSALKAAILPRPSARPADGPDTPLVIAGMFRTGNGLGRAARACFEALKAEGAAPLAVDLSQLFHQADLETSLPLAPMMARRRGTLILFANPPELERALMGLRLRRWHDWHIIGAWAWELPSAPTGWARQTPHVSEIWAPSDFVARAFSARYDRHVRTVPHHVPVLAQPSSSPDSSERPGLLRILTLADARSSLERKNPLSAIRMFQAAFQGWQAARLVVKCRNLSLYPAYAARLHAVAAQDQRVEILDATLSEPDQMRLIDRSDIILSPHRSEGFGVHLAEAMARGKPVIATGWSGNLEFMDETCSILLPYRLQPVIDPTGVYTPEPGLDWAEADFEAGVEALRRLGADADGRARLGAAARAAVEARLGTRAYRNALQPT